MLYRFRESSRDHHICKINSMVIYKFYVKCQYKMSSMGSVFTQVEKLNAPWIINFILSVCLCNSWKHWIWNCGHIRQESFMNAAHGNVFLHFEHNVYTESHKSWWLFVEQLLLRLEKNLRSKNMSTGLWNEMRKGFVAISDYFSEKIFYFKKLKSFGKTNVLK